MKDEGKNRRPFHPSLRTKPTRLFFFTENGGCYVYLSVYFRCFFESDIGWSLESSNISQTKNPLSSRIRLLACPYLSLRRRCRTYRLDGRQHRHKLSVRRSVPEHVQRRLPPLAVRVEHGSAVHVSETPEKASLLVPDGIDRCKTRQRRFDTAACLWRKHIVNWTAQGGIGDWC